MLPLAADDDVHAAIIRGLRRREPAIDLVWLQEVGMKGTPDPDVLEWAATEGRVLVTQDKKTMPPFAYDRVKAGQAMPGVIVRRKDVPIRDAIEELLLIATIGTPDDFKDQVRFLPL